MGVMGSNRRVAPYVLIADDNADILNLLATAARLRGWECDTAQTSDEILQRVKAQCEEGGRCYDVLVLDVSYEGSAISGIQAVRALRRSFPNLPVVFVTGHGGLLVKEEALRVGQEFIRKPFTPDYVLDRAEVWMTWAGTRTSNYDGPERRRSSINRSGNYRRMTDRPIEFNERVVAATAGRQE